MGRQKQNKPRQQRALRRVGQIAGMLDLPAALSGEGRGDGDGAGDQAGDGTGTGSGTGSGVVLDVAAVGFPGDGYATGGRAAYIRLADGSVKLLPEGLREWARGVIGTELDRRASGEGTMFPCRIEFGINDAGEYAELL